MSRVRAPLATLLPVSMALLFGAALFGVPSCDRSGDRLEMEVRHTDRLGTMFGAPLVHAPAAPAIDRRGDSFLLASSYGAVYAMLRQNGRRLYVVDTLNSRDYAYDLALAFPGTRVTVTAAERAVNHQLIAEQIAEIGTFFGFDAQP